MTFVPNESEDEVAKYGFDAPLPISKGRMKLIHLLDDSSNV